MTETLDSDVSDSDGSSERQTKWEEERLRREPDAPEAPPGLPYCAVGSQLHEREKLEAEVLLRETSSPHELANTWIDGPELSIFNEEPEEKPAELLGFSWRSEPEEWQERKWVKVDSVMDSGASAPVAPPSMLPNVKVEESEGSKRKQKFTSASKHKLLNLGQQLICACTEEGDDMDVLFQIADVSKPLVSVSAICERGNRVIFGRSGGVVKNIATGHEIPFHRRNGIYVLSMWMADGPTSPAAGSFRRP